MARVHLAMGAAVLADDRAALFSAAEANAIKALSLAPDYPWAHLALGGVQIFTNRAARGIAEFEQVLRLDRNSADAHAYTGLAKVFLGRPAETKAARTSYSNATPSGSFSLKPLALRRGRPPRSSREFGCFACRCRLTLPACPVPAVSSPVRRGDGASRR